MAHTKQEEFIQRVAPLVQKYAPQYGICVCSPIIAQAVLESGAGTSELALNANNFHGMKYKTFADGVYYKIGSEQLPDGSYVSSAMQWCKFNTFERGIEGYFKFISASRYANLKGITDPKKYLETIKADGYATSLKYVDNLMKVISQYDLTKYDKQPVPTPTPEPSSKKLYKVQLGYYKVKSNADAMVKRLKDKGFDCFIAQDGDAYRVQTGAYSQKVNAERKAVELKAHGFNAIIKEY